jgi:hypothetical protein
MSYLPTDCLFDDDLEEAEEEDNDQEWRDD